MMDDDVDADGWRWQVDASSSELYVNPLTVPIKVLNYGSPGGAAYVILQREPGAPIAPETFHCELHFTVRRGVGVPFCRVLFWHWRTWRKDAFACARGWSCVCVCASP
jgi:hypothetical protein